MTLEGLEQFAGDLIEMIQLIGSKGTDLDALPASVGIAVAVEAVGLSVDLLQHVVGPVIAVGAVEILDVAILGGVPDAVGQVAGFVKDIGDTGAGTAGECIGAGDSGLFGPAEVVPGVIDQIPAVLQFAQDGVAVALSVLVVELAGELGLAGADAGFAEVVVVAVDQLNAGDLLAVQVVGIIDPAVSLSDAVGVFLAVGPGTGEGLTAATLQHAVGDFKGMAGGGNGGAPVNDRHAYIAIGSASVAGFGTGGSLVLDCFCSMGQMPVIGFILNLGFCGKEIVEDTQISVKASVGIGNLTTLHFQINRSKGAATLGAHIRCCNQIFIQSFSTCYIVHIVRPGPYSQRNRHNCLLTGECAVCVLCDGQLDRVCQFHKFIRHIKTLCYRHIGQFPGVRMIQADLRFHPLNGRNIGHLQIHIVDRIVLSQLTGVVVTGDPDGLAAGDGQDLHVPGNRSHIISNFKNHFMIAGGQGNFLAGHSGSGSRDILQCHAVHIDFCRGIIQAGSVVSGNISNIRRKQNFIGAAGCVKAHTVIHNHILGIADNGGIPVFYRIGIVQSEVVIVEGILIGFQSLKIETQEAGFSSGILARVMGSNIIIAADIRIHVDPTACLCGFRIRFTIQIFTGILHQEVAANGICTLCRGTTVELILHSKASCVTRIAYTNQILRQVDPHTQSSSIQAIRHITEYSLFSHIKQDIVFPVTILVIVSFIQGQAQSIFAILYLTIFRSSKESIRRIGFRSIAVIHIPRRRSIRIIHQISVVILFMGITVCRGQRACISQAILRYPLNCLIKALPVGNITVFKVPEDFGGLAVRDGNAHLGQLTAVVVNSSQSHIGKAAVIRCSQRKAIHGTGIFLREGECKVRSLDNDRESTATLFVVVAGGHLHISSLAIGHNHAGLVKAHCCGIHNVDFHFANHSIFVNHLQFYRTGLTGRSETAISDGAESFIVNRPFHICRNLNRITGRADTGCGNLDLGIRGVVRCLSFQSSSLESIRGRNSRINDQAVGDSTLGAIRRSTDNLNFAFTFGPGQISGRTAAIQTQQILHSQFLCHLDGMVIVKTLRAAGIIAVTVDQDQVAIIRHTNKRTRIIEAGTPVGGTALCCSRAGLIYHAVLHQQLETADRFLNCAMFFHRCIPVGIIAATGNRAICKLGKPGGIAGFGNTKTGNTIHHVGTGRYAGGGIVTITVDTGHNSIVCNIVISISRIAVQISHVSNLLGHLGDTGGRTLGTAIGGVQTNLRIAQIRNGHKVFDITSVRSVGLIDGLGNTWRQRGRNSIIGMEIICLIIGLDAQ